MQYVYPAVFTTTEEGIHVDFPDLKYCYTDGIDIKDAFINAEDVLNLVLLDMEEEKKPIPEPSDPKSIVCDEKSFVSLVSADTVEYRKLLGKG